MRSPEREDDELYKDADCLEMRGLCLSSLTARVEYMECSTLSAPDHQHQVVNVHY